MKMIDCLKVAAIWQAGILLLPSLFANAGGGPESVDMGGDSLHASPAFELMSDPIQIPRGRPTLNEGRSTFVADNGELLRGPYQSTEWSSAPPFAEVEAIRDLGFNAMHLYAEVFDPNYPAPGSNSPGYAVGEVDEVVNATRELGMYLVMTIGNGANNGNHNPAYARDFWHFYAERYKDETHVIFEVHNEPVAWGAPYITHTTPTGGLDLQVEVYNVIRSHAPDTPVLLFSYAVFGSAENALMDIRAFNNEIYGSPEAVWTNTAVAFHGYAGDDTAGAVEALVEAGYPCFMTEFIGTPWGGSSEGQYIVLTAELERLDVSWLSFLTVPPDGVSPLVDIPEHYKDLIDLSGISWKPDFGNWPVQRGVFGNDGVARMTTTTFVNDFLTGALRIQAEDFDVGGQDVAYHVEEDINHGGLYRPDEGVEIVDSPGADGGYAVRSDADGEWFEYTMRAAEAGFYDLTIRYATPDENRQVRVHYQAEDKTGIWELPSTGGTSTWRSETRQVFLERAQRILRLEVVTGGLDIDWVELTPATEGPIPDGTYRLVHRETGLALTNDTSENQLGASSPDQSSAQSWVLTHLGAGQYRFASAADNWHWNLGGRNSSISTVWWWSAEGRQHRAVVRPTGDGYFRISSSSEGYDLDVFGGEAQLRFPNEGAPAEWAVLSPAAPVFPTGLTATYTAPTRIDLVWAQAPGATHFTIQRSEVSGGPYTTIATEVTGVTYRDETVSEGGDYYYIVFAESPGGTSLPSAEAYAARPVVHLKFDDSRSIVARDSSGNGWDGNLSTGASWTSGIIGRSVDLDGSSGHVTLPTGVVADLTDFTIATWVQLDSRSSWSRVFDFGSGTNNYMFLTPEAVNGNARFAIRTPATGEQVIDCNAPLPVGEWVHLAVTRNGSLGIIYFDGVEVGRSSSIGHSPASLGETNQNYIGRSQFPADPFLDGRVDDFRIYPTALTGSDVRALIDSSKEPEAPGDLEATSGLGRVLLSWSAADGAQWYTVARATESGGPYTALATGISGTGYADASVGEGTTYYYAVYGENIVGTGPPSNEVSGSSSPAPAAKVWLAFDEGEGSVAADSMGEGWDAALAGGATWTEGRFGSAVGFSGNNPHLAFPAGLVSDLEDFTISTWVKVTSQANWSRIFDFGSGTDNYMFLTSSHGNSGIARFAIRTPNVGEQIIDGVEPLPIGSWVNVVVTMAGSTGTLYVNGAAVGTNASMSLTPSDLGQTPANYIGRSQWPDPYFNGEMDDFRIYERALSPWEIEVLSSPPQAPGGLVANAESGRIDLSWTGASGADGYRLARGSASGGPYTVVAHNQADVAFSDTDVEAGVTYYYVVTAMNAAGESRASNEASAAVSQLPGNQVGAPRIAVTEGTVEIGVFSEVGRAYQLQYRDDLAEGEWQDYGEPRIGTGEEIEFTMLIAPEIPRRFFRVVIE